MPKSRIRIATLQYYIRPVSSFDDFAEQVRSFVATAADYKCNIMVFPEYFTIQLLTLSDIHQPITQQVRWLARQRERFIELMSGLSREHKIYIVGGSIPAIDTEDGEVVHNDCYVFSPFGEHGVQGKLHLTRWESEEWLVSPREGVKVFDTDIGKFAVAICYDVEFPEIARAAAKAGCYLLIVPSATDDRQGYLRVRYCAQARAIENQMYVVHSCTVGSLPMIPTVSMNYGQASILTPSDFSFARDGILAEGNVNQEQVVLGDLDLDIIQRSREQGTVLPLRDSNTTAHVTSRLDVIQL